MDRRTFLKTTGAGALLAGAGVTWAQSNLKPLPILPLVDLAAGFDGRFELALTKGTFDFGNGAASDTFGINSPYLGQQLRVKQGQDLPFDVVNNLDEVAAIHWHGLHIPGEVDGGAPSGNRAGSFMVPGRSDPSTGFVQLVPCAYPRAGCQTGVYGAGRADAG